MKAESTHPTVIHITQSSKERPLQPLGRTGRTSPQRVVSKGTSPLMDLTLVIFAVTSPLPAGKVTCRVEWGDGEVAGEVAGDGRERERGRDTSEGDFARATRMDSPGAQRQSELCKWMIVD